MNKLQALSDSFSNKIRGHRKNLLKNLITKIYNDDYSNVEIDPNKLYLLHNSVRREYQSPLDISGYNWGQTNVWDMDAGMEDAY